MRWIMAVSLAASALVVGSAHAACVAENQRVPASEMGDFAGNPGQVLERNPAGGGAMISRVRDLLVTDRSALAPVMSLISQANPAQKSALASALAQAARMCVSPDQGYSADIQRMVTETGDQGLIGQYASIAGDAPIAAGPGSASGSSGAVGGQTNGTGTAAGSGGSAEQIGGRGGVGTGNANNAGAGGVSTAGLTGTQGSSTNTTTAVVVTSPAQQ